MRLILSSPCRVQTAPETPSILTVRRSPSWRALPQSKRRPKKRGFRSPKKIIGAVTVGALKAGAAVAGGLALRGSKDAAVAPIHGPISSDAAPMASIEEPGSAAASLYSVEPGSYTAGPSSNAGLLASLKGSGSAVSLDFFDFDSAYTSVAMTAYSLRHGTRHGSARGLHPYSYEVAKEGLPKLPKVRYNALFCEKRGNSEELRGLASCRSSHIHI